MKKKVVLGSLIVATIIIIGLFICSYQPFIIDLYGDEVMEISYNEIYQEPGAQSILGLGEVKIEGEVENGVLGEYVLNYYYANTFKQRKVIVCDKKKPEIELNGPSSITLAIGGIYREYGASAYDEIDGDLTDSIEIVNEVDVNNEGEYYVFYYSKDEAGNRARVRRTVHIVADGPLVQPLDKFSLDGCFEGTILKETSEDTSERFANMLFVGDSIFDNLAIYGYLEMDQTWARHSMGPENVYTREIHIPRSRYTLNYGYFFEALEANKPEYMTLLMGTVDMFSCSTEYFVDCYRDFLVKFKETSPETQLIIVSILPVARSVNDAAVRNDRINKVNYYLAEMAQEYGYYFMNLAEALKDKDGYGNSALLISDGIHPTPYDGCQLVMDYIQSHLSY